MSEQVNYQELEQLVSDQSRVHDAAFYRDAADDSTFSVDWAASAPDSLHLRLPGDLRPAPTGGEGPAGSPVQDAVVSSFASHLRALLCGDLLGFEHRCQDSDGGVVCHRADHLLQLWPAPFHHQPGAPKIGLES